MEPWGLGELPHWELGADGTQKHATGWPTQYNTGARAAGVAALERAQRQVQRWELALLRARRWVKPLVQEWAVQE